MTSIKISTINELNLVRESIQLISTDETFEQNWSKITNNKTYDELVKELNKKNKKTKKRNKSGYTMYTKDLDIQEKLNDKAGKKLTVGEMSSVMSQSWKNASHDLKDKFNKLALEFNEQNVSVDETNNVKKPPRRTGYNEFLGNKEYRENLNKETNNELNMFELNKLMVSKWKIFTEAEKEIYKQTAADKNKLSEVVKEDEEDKKEDKVEKEDEVEKLDTTSKIVVVETTVETTVKQENKPKKKKTTNKK